MTTYLITCECGKKVPVEVGQAGGQVACECGAQIAVPTLRKLRHLPVAEPTKPAEVRAEWNVRKGILAAALIAAGVLVAVAAWSWFTEPTVPEFPADHVARITTALEELTPAEGWRLWVEAYRPLAHTGFSEFSHPHAPAIQQAIAERRFLQKVLLSLAAVAAVIALAAAFWPSPKPVRR